MAIAIKGMLGTLFIAGTLLVMLLIISAISYLLKIVP
jgi:hypothetical protein